MKQLSINPEHIVNNMNIPSDCCWYWNVNKITHVPLKESSHNVYDISHNTGDIGLEHFEKHI